jgi:Protein of unknown function (DUF4031)
MAVYVDDMTAPFGRMKMCHMFADTTQELLTMAIRIGVQQRWLRHAGTYKEHFDICLSKPRVALRYGAQAITWKEATQFVAKKRCLSLGEVDDGRLC